MRRGRCAEVRRQFLLRLLSVIVGVAVVGVLAACGSDEPTVELGPLGEPSGGSESASPTPAESPTPTPTLPPDEQAAFDEAEAAYRLYAQVKNQVFQRGRADPQAIEQLLAVSGDPLFTEVQSQLLIFEQIQATQQGGSEVVWINADNVDLSSETDVVTMIACLDNSSLTRVGADGVPLPEAELPFAVVTATASRLSVGWRISEGEFVEGRTQC